MRHRPADSFLSLPHTKKIWYGGHTHCLSPNLAEAIKSYENIMSTIIYSVNDRRRNDTARFVTYVDACLSTPNLPLRKCECSKTKSIGQNTSPVERIISATEYKDDKELEPAIPESKSVKNININIEVKVRKKKKKKPTCESIMLSNLNNARLCSCKKSYVKSTTTKCAPTKPVTLVDLPPKRKSPSKFLQFFQFCKKVPHVFVCDEDPTEASESSERKPSEDTDNISLLNIKDAADRARNSYKSADKNPTAPAAAFEENHIHEPGYEIHSSADRLPSNRLEDHPDPDRKVHQDVCICCKCKHKRISKEKRDTQRKRLKKSNNAENTHLQENKTSRNSKEIDRQYVEDGDSHARAEYPVRRGSKDSNEWDENNKRRSTIPNDSKGSYDTGRFIRRVSTQNYSSDRVILSQESLVKINDQKHIDLSALPKEDPDKDKLYTKHVDSRIVYRHHIANSRETFDKSDQYGEGVRRKRSKEQLQLSKSSSRGSKTSLHDHPEVRKNNLTPVGHAFTSFMDRKRIQASYIFFGTSASNIVDNNKRLQFTHHIFMRIVCNSSNKWYGIDKFSDNEPSFDAQNSYDMDEIFRKFHRHKLEDERTRVRTRRCFVKGNKPKVTYDGFLYFSLVFFHILYLIIFLYVTLFY